MPNVWVMLSKLTMVDKGQLFLVVAHASRGVFARQTRPKADRLPKLEMSR